MDINSVDENSNDQFLLEEVFSDEDLRYLDIIIDGCNGKKPQPTAATDCEEIFFDDSDDDEIELLLEKIPNQSRIKEKESQSKSEDIIFIGPAKPSSLSTSRQNIYNNLANRVLHSNQPKSSHNRGYIENYSLVDPRLESLDPTPDIQKLFREFDLKFFDDILHQQPHFLGVKWCGRLTKSAGIFTVWNNRISRTTLSHIKLSSKLLSLRPRSDLVHTLLHEMIHAYIYYTGIEDDGSHGHRFQNLMWQINKAAGTNVTVYHTFKNEIDYHQNKLKNVKRKKMSENVPPTSVETLVSFFNSKSND